MRANEDLRKYAKKKNVFFWQIAEALEICEMTLSRKLRHELPDEEKQRIFAIIEELAKEAGQ